MDGIYDQEPIRSRFPTFQIFSKATRYRIVQPGRISSSQPKQCVDHSLQVLYRAYLLIREKRAMEDARRNQRSLMAHANTAIRIGHQFLQNGMV